MCTSETAPQLCGTSEIFIIQDKKGLRMILKFDNRGEAYVM